jgi:hypothetical protein
MTLIDKACYERGCACYDDRVDVDAVEVVLAQTQEPVPPPWWPAVENILNEYGLQAIDFVADFKQALAQTQEPVHNVQSNGRHSPLLTHMMNKQATPPQRTWVDLTDEDVMGLCRTFMGQFDKTKFIKATEDKIKELNT